MNPNLKKTRDLLKATQALLKSAHEKLTERDLLIDELQDRVALQDAEHEAEVKLWEDRHAELRAERDAALEAVRQKEEHRLQTERHYKEMLATANARTTELGKRLDGCRFVAFAGTTTVADCGMSPDEVRVVLEATQPEGGLGRPALVFTMNTVWHDGRTTPQVVRQLLVLEPGRDR